VAVWQNDVDERMRRHYERYPYPKYSVLGSIRRQDSYVFNLQALWAHFNGRLLESRGPERILLAGSGSFLPYPVSVANPGRRVDALDLSQKSLARARIHALRHLRFNLDYLVGDLMAPEIAPGPYHYIDSFGVLHCIPDFVEALRALERRLVEGGILRVMVYSRDGRAEVERVRALCSELGVGSPRDIRRLARKDELVRSCLAGSFEMGFDEGIADALLIPFARTFVVDELLEALSGTSLRLVRFCHQGALPALPAELARIRSLEKTRSFPTNLSFYVQRGGETPEPKRAYIVVNPGLRSMMSFPSPGSAYLPSKFGPENPVIDGELRGFLRRFLRPVDMVSLGPIDRAQASALLDRLILISYS